MYLSEESTIPPQVGNCYRYTFRVKNVTSPPIPMSYLILVPDPAGPPTCFTFSRDIIHFSPALQPGDSKLETVDVCLTGAAGCQEPFCFLAAAHNANLEQCCSTRHCLPPLPRVPPAPAPLLLSPKMAEGQASFKVQTKAGVTCWVECAESLSPPNWRVLMSIVGDGSVMTVTDPITNAPCRFYRISVE